MKEPAPPPPDSSLLLLLLLSIYRITFLRRLDWQDLEALYRLAQEKFQDHPLEGHDLMLWGDLRMIFDPNTEDEINMLVEKKYPLTKDILKKMLRLQLEAEEESTMALELIKFIKSLLEEE
ncbi:hypothetical protein Tco_1047521 [Tanacetum coccineum]